MRRFLILICFLIWLGSNIHGKDMKFFEDGKSWHCTMLDPETSNLLKVKVSVVGDTVVSGIPARILESELIETGEKYPNRRVVKEEDGAVSVWLNGEFRLLFDLGAGEEIITLRDYFGNPLYDFEWGMQTGACVYRDIEGIVRKVYQIHFGDGEVFSLSAQYIIDGIGSYLCEFVTRGTSEDPYWNYRWLDECYLNDRLVYSENNYLEYPIVDPSADPNLSSIKGVVNDDIDESLYDLMGRKVKHPQPGHIYITPSGKRVF